LEYKTQVFIYYEGDHYRTRLTHTLEVAQIGRTIARALGVNEDLVEGICLVHDLGHPPFGHSGEYALASLMKDHGGFDHNKQSLRIVTTLEKRYQDFDGLNLTWELREGIVKHETEYDSIDAAEYNPDKRGHLEAQIANAADEIAYNAHDLDDGLRSGMITIDILEGLTIWEILIESIGWKGNRLDDLSRHTLIRRLIGLEVSNLLETTNANLVDNKITSKDQVQDLDFNLVGFSEDMHRWNRELKDFLFRELYRHYRVVRMSNKTQRTITELFDAYHNQPSMLPDSSQKQIEVFGLERVICDYIAGMTDRYAIDEIQKLYNPEIKT
jgi:dGTPase